MFARAAKLDPLNSYVSAVIAVGAVCALGIVIDGVGEFSLALTPEIAIFALCAFIGDFLPLKVFTRGAEGEITTSTCFAFAALLAAGPLAALIALVAANLIVDAFRRKAAQKVAFNVAQYAISVAAAAMVLKATTGMPRPDGPHLEPSDLAGVMLAIAAFFVVNSTLVATVIALVQRTRVLRYLIDDIFNQVATGGLLLGLAPVVLLAADFFLPAIALLFLPLYAVHRGGRDAIAKQHQALHDALTGLPNRELFRDRIDQAVSRSRRDGDAAVVMIMDLDHFKEINDTLGHHMGDLLLQEVSRRLRVALRDSDTVARLGGDEFGILLPRVDTTEDGTTVAQNLLAHLREPFVLEGMRLEIDASVGLALHPLHGEDNETLQQRADIAMYSAKQSGRGFAVFEAELDRHSPRRLALAGGMRVAINEGQIQLYYQPKADLRTGRIMGVEALARWDHPEFGIVGPSEFVPIAEQTGLITPLTSFVLDAAIRQVRTWNDSGLELSVAVNLSARSFLDTQLAVEIPRLLARWDVEAEQLELEITESMLMTDPARAEATLTRLSQIGLTLSVDDFGTGYSSLANLKRLPVDVIKIDKSFVMEMAVDASDAAIVRSTIDLAHNLGLKVVAEGVESEDAWRQLETLGCDFAQGYYLSRPLPAEAATRLIRERGTGRDVPPPALRVVRGLAL
ncbi:EAL domain-containing protein [Solirubrobacter ginsenosidimutans]|uniref:EAL domain-containing protein n=1 Tax=Solirubrobacter ginsenosidimutans TaxID=490573 RepID=A0A9X3N027_9ACTN|nr:EAL domain-containing protein [Solirubrobacter ginsenosidimutans]MDA0165940.1 EAL domain-containing protein [Solirubrobacter ginsenosidimutans]